MAHYRIWRNEIITKIKQERQMSNEWKEKVTINKTWVWFSQSFAKNIRMEIFIRSKCVLCLYLVNDWAMTS